MFGIGFLEQARYVGDTVGAQHQADGWLQDYRIAPRRMSPSGGAMPPFIACVREPVWIRSGYSKQIGSTDFKGARRLRYLMESLRD